MLGGRRWNVFENNDQICSTSIKDSIIYRTYRIKNSRALFSVSQEAPIKFGSHCDYKDHLIKRILHFSLLDFWKSCWPQPQVSRDASGLNLYHLPRLPNTQHHPPSSWGHILLPHQDCWQRTISASLSPKNQLFHPRRQSGWPSLSWGW